MLEPRPLKGRLTLWYAGVLAVVLLAFSAAAHFSLGGDLTLVHSTAAGTGFALDLPRDLPA